MVFVFGNTVFLVRNQAPEAFAKLMEMNLHSL